MKCSSKELKRDMYDLHVFLELVKEGKGVQNWGDNTLKKWRELWKKGRLTAKKKGLTIYSLCQADHTVLSYKELWKISQPWVLKLFLQNKTCHCTFPKSGLYFWRFFLWFASFLNGEHHVAHQVQDFFTCHLKDKEKELMWSFWHWKQTDSTLTLCAQLGSTCTQRLWQCLLILQVAITVRSTYREGNSKVKSMHHTSEGTITRSLLLRKKHTNKRKLTT